MTQGKPLSLQTRKRRIRRVPHLRDTFSRKGGWISVTAEQVGDNLVCVSVICFQLGGRGVVLLHGGVCEGQIAQDERQLRMCDSCTGPAFSHVDGMRQL